ncbi:tripartite tricarboxylate transporter substrate binding protein [Roseomonas sp. SSH11]|uniref:Tripartite tricarboxylate transporter substrate binding protein n=1 Tax=Pararoseomonas baculiformis TaxID=2820812 RepID=A0ABS4A931_9PROT|nr:tripartite tricarboxylate transporter substrate binding protein [Pararoseomonas baculiformis]MBP0443509.1 tripartite tricarboxylate transporter substrate binding protein [Pararoseomonas baculiformis]
MKNILGAILGTALCVAACGGAAAQPAAPYPDRPVQMVVSWQAGGVVDTIGRALAQAMSDLSEGRFVVINRDGASGIVGAQAVSSARPDGYTIGFGPITPITTASHTVRGVPFTVDSFEYVCKVFENVLAVSVAETSPFRSMPELIAAIRARPDTMTYGHFGTNSLGHISFANIVRGLSLRVTDVPFRGETPIYPEMLSGRLDFGMGTVGGARGKPVRLLAVFGDQRSAAAPDVPSTRELGLPTLQPVLSGITVPRGTPAAITERLETLCRQGTEESSFRTVMGRLGEPILYAGQEAFTAQARRDNAEKIEVVRALGLVPQ